MRSDNIGQNCVLWCLIAGGPDLESSAGGCQCSKDLPKVNRRRGSHPGVLFSLFFGRINQLALGLYKLVTSCKQLASNRDTWLGIGNITLQQFQSR